MNNKQYINYLIENKDPRLATFIKEMAIDTKKMGAKEYRPTTVGGLVRSVKTRGRLARRSLKRSGQLATDVAKVVTKNIGSGLAQMKEKGNDLLLAAYVNASLKAGNSGKNLSNFKTVSKEALMDSIKGLKLGGSIIKRFVSSQKELKDAFNKVMLEYMTDPRKQMMLRKNLIASDPISAASGVAIGIMSNLAIQLNDEYNITGKKLDPKVKNLLMSDKVRNAIGSSMAVFLLTKVYPSMKQGIKVSADLVDDMISYFL